MVSESQCSNVLVRPDLAEALGIFFGATATQITYCDRLEIHMNRMIPLVQFLASTIPLLAIGLVALTSLRSVTNHTECRVFAHTPFILTKKRGQVPFCR